LSDTFARTAFVAHSLNDEMGIQLDYGGQSLKEKDQDHIDASGGMAMTGTEILVPSHNVRDGEKTCDLITIDPNSQHANARRQMPARQAAGPRTELGKRRSSRNAIRHGIFSEGILLKSESRPQLDSLRTKLCEALLPTEAP
jgi:hypothetical protein